MVTQLESDEALNRGKETLRTQPRAISVGYDALSHRIVVELNTGYAISFSPQRAQGLETATSEDLAVAEIAFPGFGIHFPAIDADLWVPGLAQGIFGSKHWESDWRAAHPLESTPYPVAEAPEDEAEDPVHTEAA